MVQHFVCYLHLLYKANS